MPFRTLTPFVGHALTILLCAHGAIHFLGFAKAFGMVELSALRPIGRGHGLLWLVAGWLLLAGAALRVAWPEWWWVAAAPGVLLSEIAIVTAFRDAKLGTVPNLILLLPIVYAMAQALPSSLPSRYVRDASAEANRAPTTPVVTEADLVGLPEAVRAYLRYAGVVGHPRVASMSLRFQGQIRSKVGGPWMDFHADQRSYFGPQARYFFLESSLFGLPFVAFHRYAGDSATMEVKAAGLVTVADARGPEMNQSETVTVLNDMCVFAPSSLLGANVRWETLEPLIVRATFTNAGQTVRAKLFFNQLGQLVDFQSDDRYMSSDGKLYERYRWSTPLSSYREFGGVRVASHGDAAWTLPSGEFVYGRFDVVNLKYNVEGGAP